MGQDGSIDIKTNSNIYTEKTFLRILYNQNTRLLNIKFTLDNPGKLDWKIYNLSGREIMNLFSKSYFKKGSYTLNCPINIKTPGVYFLHINGNGISLAEKFFILK